MLKTSACRLIAGATTLCVVQMLSANRVWAQTSAPDVPAPSQREALLLPLEPGTMAIGEMEMDAITHQRVADSINAEFTDDPSADESANLNLADIPIIGDLLDAEGNFDWGMDLPISVNLGNVMGDYGLVFSADFAMD
ncbi:MAG: hypothetical protein ACR2FS_10815 [Phormidesmis sp.]